MRNWMAYLWAAFMAILAWIYSLGPANHGYDGAIYGLIAMLISMGFAFAFPHLYTDRIVAWVWGGSLVLDCLFWLFVGIRDQWQALALYRVLVNFFPIAMMIWLMLICCFTLVTNMLLEQHVFIADRECWNCQHRFAWRAPKCPNCGRSA